MATLIVQTSESIASAPNLSTLQPPTLTSWEGVMLVVLVVNLVWTSLLGSGLACSPIGLNRRSSPHLDTAFYLFPIVGILVTFALESICVIQLLGNSGSASLFHDTTYYLAYLGSQLVTAFVMQTMLICHMKDLATRLPILTVPCVLGYEILQPFVAAFWIAAFNVNSQTARVQLVLLLTLIFGVSLGICLACCGFMVPKCFILPSQDSEPGRLCRKLLTGTVASGFVLTSFMVMNLIHFLDSPFILQPMVHIGLSKAYMTALAYLLYTSERDITPENDRSPCTDAQSFPPGTSGFFATDVISYTVNGSQTATHAVKSETAQIAGTMMQSNAR